LSQFQLRLVLHLSYLILLAGPVTGAAAYARTQTAIKTVAAVTASHPFASNQLAGEDSLIRMRTGKSGFRV
jgi:hypothetical protein